MNAKYLLLILTVAILLPLTAISQDTGKPADESKQAETSGEKKSSEKSLNLEQILAKYYDAIGGLEKWRQLNTMIMKGTLISPKSSMPITAYHERPNKCRVEFEIEDTVMAQIFSGSLGWQLNPLSGNPDPAPMTRGRSNYMRDTCDIESSLIDYEDKGRKVKLVAKAGIDGKEYYQISVKYPSRNFETYYINAETFLIDRSVGIYDMDGNQLRTTTKFTNYKKTDGYVVPYNLEIEIHGAPGKEKLNISSFQFNTEIDSNIFEFPKDKMIDLHKMK